MSDSISKVIGVMLAFILLVLAPMTIMRMTADMAAKRLVLNEVGMFIDKVTDKGSITGVDIDNLLLGINAHGGTFDMTVIRYIRVAVKDESSGEVRSVYYASDDDITNLPFNGLVNLNAGDAIQVNVDAVSRTKGQVLIQGFLRVFEPPFSFTLAGTVR